MQKQMTSIISKQIHRLLSEYKLDKLLLMQKQMTSIISKQIHRLLSEYKLDNYVLFRQKQNYKNNLATKQENIPLSFYRVSRPKSACTYSKTFVKRPLKNRQNKGLNDKW